jgi:hypothetical protein
MWTLALASLLVGAALGMRFKVLILVPVILVVLLVILVVGIGSSDGFAFIALAMALAATCLQVGYLIAIATRQAAARSGRVQRIWQRRAASAR